MNANSIPKHWQPEPFQVCDGTWVAKAVGTYTNGEPCPVFDPANRHYATEAEALSASIRLIRNVR